MKTTGTSDDDDPWAAIAAPAPTTRAKPLSAGRGRGAKPTASKLGAQRINRTSSGIYLIFEVKASIHEYKNEAFIPRFNSFFFHGGSEGLYASKVHDNSTKPTSEEKPLNGKSFIRFESITFRRTIEATNKQNEMQQKTGLVEAIIVEVKDRDKIGGSYISSDAICCTPALANDGSCKVGEVIIRQDPDNPGWPKRIQTSFEGRIEDAQMLLQTVEINKTGMYYLYFMFCDPELKGTLMSGRTVWRNPEGYLPGKMAPLMTFYGLMSLAYLVLGLVWFLSVCPILEGYNTIALPHHNRNWSGNV
ncbi:hypothetical protein F0562_026393 [Nyssa sinensis]|uniref:Uncharacterized protein n=1 Tax=Nyssa sinensis TaxID=561372 RepID=A0A5J5BEW5_9ASTE|nr:hypothetical protein F0562_026393 [Nyssa sinensis]